MPLRALFVSKVAGLVSGLAVFGAIFGTENAVNGTIIVSHPPVATLRVYRKKPSATRLECRSNCIRHDRCVACDCATAQECRIDVLRYSWRVAAKPCDTTVVSQIDGRMARLMQLPGLWVRHSEQSLQVVIKRLCPPEDVEAEDDVKAAPQRVQYPERALPLNLNDG